MMRRRVMAGQEEMAKMALMELLEKMGGLVVG
jgi:hypothetical protein